MTHSCIKLVISACKMFKSNAGTIAMTWDLNCVVELYNASEVTAPVNAPRPISRVLEGDKILSRGHNGFCYLFRSS